MPTLSLELITVVYFCLKFELWRQVRIRLYARMKFSYCVEALLVKKYPVSCWSALFLLEMSFCQMFPVSGLTLDPSLETFWTQLQFWLEQGMDQDILHYVQLLLSGWRNGMSWEVNQSCCGILPSHLLKVWFPLFCPNSFLMQECGYL